MLRRVAVLALAISLSAARQASAEPEPTRESGADRPAPVDDDQRARELYLRGDRLYAEGDYDGAIDAFQGAYDLSGRPLLLFNLANAYERAGRLESAIDALRRYAPDAPVYEHEGIAQRIRRLEERLQPRAAGAPAGSPAESAAPAPPPAEPAAARSPEPAGADGATGGGTLRAVGWILTATGGALMVGGGVAGVVALDARSDARAHCQDGLCTTDAKAPISRDQTASLLADVGLVAGSVGLASGIVMLLLAPASDEVGWARLSVRPDGVGLTLSDRF